MVSASGTPRPLDPPVPRPGLIARLPAALVSLVGRSVQEEQDRFLRSLHAIRLGLVALNLLLTFGLGWWGPQWPDLKVQAPIVAGYMAASVIIFILSRRSLAFLRWSRFTIAIVDIPFILWMEAASLPTYSVMELLPMWSALVFLFFIVLSILVLDPRTIAADALASDALRIFEEKHITSLFITDAAKKLLGLIHLHDLWRVKLF